MFPLVAIYHLSISILETSCYAFNSKIKKLAIATIFLSFINPFSNLAQNDFQLNGTAAVIGTDCYELTPAQANKFGSIWYKQKIDLAKDFTMNTNMYFGTKDATGADGIVFAFQGVCTNAGSSGGGLGIAGISPSIFVEIDTWQNTGTTNDPVNDHISIFKNGINNHGSTDNLSATVQASSTSANIEDGAYHNVRFEWIASSKTLSVYFDNAFRTSYTGDIVNTIFGGNQYVYYGFTAATGGSNNIQRVCLVNPPKQNDAVICNGSSTNLVINGAGVGTYSWSPSNTLNTSTGTSVIANPSTTTTYTVTGTGGSCGAVSFNITVTVVPIPSPALNSSTAVCEGSTKTYSTALHAGSTYAWTVTGAASYTTNLNTVTITAGTNNYTISVIETEGVKGCSNAPGSGVSTTTIVVNKKPVISAIGGTYCIGAIGKTISASGAGSSGSYLWSPSTNLSANNIASPIASPNTNTTYTVTGTDINGCSNTATATVNSFPRPNITTNSGAYCIGGNGVNLNASGAGTGGIYSWTPTTNLNAANIANPTAKPTITSTYTVTGTDINSCSNTATAIVTVNSLPNVIANASAIKICMGNNVKLFGSGALNYTWDNGVNNNINFNPTSTKTYTVIGTDANLCSNSATINITVNALPNVTATSSNSNICAGQTTSLTAIGASTYSWNNGVVNGAIFTPNTTKTYTVIGTDVNLCTDTATVSIIVNAKPIVTATTSTNAVCIGKPITLKASGAASYTWNNGAIDNVAFNPTVTKTYTVTGADVNGCTNTANINITVFALPNVVAITSKTSICLGQSVTLSGSGAISYSWNNGVTNGVAFAPQTTQAYTLTGTDLNTCQNTATVNIVVNQIPVNPITRDLSLCKNDPNPDLSSYVIGSNLRWYDDANNGNLISSPAINTTNSGVSNLYVSQTDANTCESLREKITIKVNDYPTAKIISTDLSYCKGQQNGVTLQAQDEGAGLTYEWFKNAISNANSNDIKFNNALAGLWTVKVKNNTSGCESISTQVTVIEQIPPIAEIINIGPALEYCKNNPQGTQLYATDAGANTTYQWFKNGIAQSTASGTNKIYNNAYAGTWSLKVISTLTTCPSTSAQVVVLEKSVPIANITTTGNQNDYCAGSTGVTLTAQAINGAFYEWFKNGVSSGSGNTHQNSLGGTWILKVTANGCEDTSTPFIVIEKPLPIAQINSNANSYCANTSGVTLTALNVGVLATYEWFLNNISKGNSANTELTNATVGDWKLKTTMNGCSQFSNIKKITIDSLPTAQITTTGDQLTYCQYASGVTLTAKDQGTGSVYEWYKDELLVGTTPNNSFPNATKGNWTMKVMNKCGAMSQSISPVSEKSLPQASFTANKTEYCQNTTGANLTAKIVNGAYYQWYKNGVKLGSSTQNNVLSNALNGSYTVSVSLNGCDSLSSPLVIKENPSPSATLSDNKYICNKIGDSTQLTINLTGQAPWKISYQKPDGSIKSINTNTSPLMITEAEKGNYKPISISDLNCNGVVNGLGVIHHYSVPKIVNATRTCFPSAKTFKVEFDIIDGDASTYIVAGVKGTLTGNHFISDSINENIIANISINDINNCDIITQSFSKLCSCSAEANMTGGDTICNDGIDKAKITIELSGSSPWNIEYTKDNGTPIQINGILNSPYSLYSQTKSQYKITKVSDAICQGAANGTANVDLYSFPKANIAGESSICIGKENASLQINLTGTAPWNINVKTPNGFESVSNITNNPFTYSPNIVGNYTLENVLDANCNGRIADLSGSANVIAYEKPDTSNFKIICDNSDQFYIVTNIIKGDPASYAVVGIEGTFLGNFWTSKLIKSGTFNSMTITDSKGCDPLIINGITKTCICPAKATLTGKTIYCDDSVKANAYISLEGTSPWDITYKINGGNDITVSSINNELIIRKIAQTSGFNLVSVKDAKCYGTTSGSALIVVNELPTSTVIGGGIVCENSSTNEILFTLTGTPPYQFVYTDGKTNFNGISNNGLYKLTKPGNGIYSMLAITDANGCIAENMSGAATVQNRKNISARINGDTGICAGTATPIMIIFDSLQNAPYKLTYSGDNGYEIIENITSNPYQIDFQPKTSTSVKIIEIADEYRCYNQNFNDSAIVNVSQIPQVKIINNLNYICSGTATAINLISTTTGTENNTTFRWSAQYSNKVNGVIAPSEGDSIYQILTNLGTDVEQITYNITPITYTTNNNACYGTSKDTKVSIRKPTIPNLGTDLKDICIGNQVSFDAGDFKGGVYSWFINDSISPETTHELSFKLNEGQTKVKVNFLDICNIVHSDSLNIDSKQKINIDFTSADTCFGTTSNLTPTSFNQNNVDLWTWNIVNTGEIKQTTESNANLKINFGSIGKQTIKVEAFSNGCKIGDTAKNVNIQNCDFEIVNTFTPNGDGQNDVWVIKGIERYPNAHLVIMNRWGMIVHELPGKILPWNGTNDKEEALEDGVYYYIITLNKVAGSNETIQGHINLLTANND
jgi:gliding motility-associated-like protein